MNVLHITRWCVVAALPLLLSAMLGLNHARAQSGDAPGADDGVEVLTRGPVHEAFAEVVVFDPEPGIVTPKAPPAAIEEVPPQQRPAGAHVAWIPGYWAWDDERTDFLWVSGIWRAIPPGRQWVPGYWGRSGQGAQWTSGYWADAKTGEVEYLPEPPATINVDPNVPAPSADHNWLPGTWVWNQNRYAWRPGYWEVGQSDWDWVPAHYVWTPRGYVFVDGYYDYTVARRGVLYAPVYFGSGAVTQAGFSYSPMSVVNPVVFVNHLFLRPSYGHYYYGDYYASNYSSAGFLPWLSFYTSHTGYDPFFAHERWLHRQDREWDKRAQAGFQNLVDHENARPPRTWADQRARLASAGTPGAQSFIIATSLDELAKNKESSLKLQAVDQKERQQFTAHEKAVHQHREQRQAQEGQATAPSGAKSKPSAESPGSKGKLPASPIVALPSDKLDKDHAPPKRHEAPQPDLKVAPKARGAGVKTKAVPGEPRRATGSPQAGPPKAESKGKPMREPQGAPPGRAQDKPQRAPQEKPNLEPKNAPKQ